MDLPHYVDCFVSHDWCNFQNFLRFYKNAVGNQFKEWQVDKDLLFVNNKEYSTEKCVLVPSEVNMLVCRHPLKNSGLPVGVVAETGRPGRYKSIIKEGSKSIHLGYGREKDIPELFLLYKHKKEALAREYAEKYVTDIDPRAYQALLDFRIGPLGRIS